MDIESVIEQHDRSHFLDLLDQFPDQVQTGWEIGHRVSLDVDRIDSVIVCGMGGSGISGDLLHHFLYHRCDVPIETNRFYDLPGWVDENTLVVPVSYSGHTEETLSAYDEAHARGATCVAVSSNGELEGTVRDRSDEVIVIPPGLPPRCAAGVLFLPLLFVMDEAGLADAPSDEAYDEATSELLKLTNESSPDSKDNKALNVARRLQGTIPLIYGSQEYTSVLAHRFKNQLNENAKMVANHQEIPELHHNEIMSWEDIGERPQDFSAVLLRDRDEHSRIQRRFSITRELLDPHVTRIDELQGRGDTLLSRFLTLMLYTDYVSYYIAVLRGKDPVAIGPIEQLKEKLDE